MRQFEVIAFAADATLTIEGARLMGHAPGGWLVVLSEESSSAALASLGAWQAAGQGVVVEVSGKYQSLPFAGEAGRRVLASTVNLDTVLPPERDCAAVMLFDAPAVLARVSTGYEAWVAGSHVRDFTAAAERASAVCEKMPG